MREGRAVNIHMFCPRRPGLLLNAMKAIEGLGLDVQQAVASCFNGFTLDVFKAEVIHNCTYFSPNCEKLAFCQNKKRGKDYCAQAFMLQLLKICTEDNLFPHENSLTSAYNYLSSSLQLCKDGPGLLPEEIKNVLLQSAGFQGVV